MKKMSMLSRIQLGLTGLGFTTAIGGMGIAYATDNYDLHKKSFGVGIIMMSTSLFINGIERLITNE